MARPRVLLDTSVWRKATREREWLRAAARRGTRLVATDEVVQELTVTALRTSSTREYEEVRLASSLVHRYAEEVLPPLKFVLARELEFADPCAPQPRAVCSLIANCPTQADAKAAAEEGIPCGSGHIAPIGRWQRGMQGEKQNWRRSLQAAIESAAPGLVTARHQGAPRHIDVPTYERLRSQLLSDARALAEIEVIEVERLMAEVGAQIPDRPAAVNRTLALLGVYVQALTEALLDRFDHPANGSRRKVKMEDNDAYDVAQLKYLRDRDVWVTDDRVWLGVAETAGIRAHVIAPHEVDAVTT